MVLSHFINEINCHLIRCANKDFFIEVAHMRSRVNKEVSKNDQLSSLIRFKELINICYLSAGTSVF